MVRRLSDGELVIRCDAGHDFCRFDENWKMDAAVFVRDSDELLRRGLPEDGPLRSRVDGAARVLLPEVRPAARGRGGRPPGYPVVHDFLPDIEGFYRGWLGRELP